MQQQRLKHQQNQLHLFNHRHWRIVEFYADRRIDLHPTIFRSQEQAEGWSINTAAREGLVMTALIYVTPVQAYLVESPVRFVPIKDQQGNPSRSWLDCPFPSGFEELRQEYWELQREFEEEAFRRADVAASMVSGTWPRPANTLRLAA